MRTRQRNSRESKEAFHNDLMKCYGTTRERLVKTGKNDQYDPKWERFVPKQRFNVDQSLLPFAVKRKKHTKSSRKSKAKITRFGLANPGAALTKGSAQCRFVLDQLVSSLA